MSVYNLTKIENWYDDFLSYQSKFKNTYYEDYKSSYIMRYSSDAIITKMKKELSSSYNRIDKIYTNLNKFWKEFIEDVEITDLVLANERKSSSINASSVAAKLSKLPQLDEYTATAGIIFDYHGASKTIDSIKYWFEENVSWESVGATAGTFVVSLSEGVVNLGEATVDLAAIIGAIGCTLAVGFATSNLPTYAQQQVNLTGEGSIINQIWEETRAFVSTDYSTIWYDDFYNTDGAWLKENAIGFDVVRSAGCEIGQIICISVLTGGAGGVAKIAGKAGKTTVQAVAQVVSKGAPVIYGASKTAQHTERNWQDENIGTFEGLVNGITQGVTDGVFFAVGMKGDKVVKNTIAKGSYNFWQKGGILAGKMLFEGGTSVAQDGTNVFIDTLFLDNKITNSDGTITTFNSFSEKLNYCYNQAGGDDMLKSSLVSAIVLSGISDRSDVYGKLFKKRGISSGSINVNKAKDINKYLSSKSSFKGTLLGITASIPIAATKTINVDIKPNTNIYKKIKNEGLYHFTDEVSAHKIIESNYIKESSYFTSYGTKKTFMFAGIPTVENACLNDVFDYKKVAVKLNVDEADIPNFKYRKYSDQAVSHKGNLDITDRKPEIAYLVLKEEAGDLKYVEVSKTEYDAYNPEFSNNAMIKKTQQLKSTIGKLTISMTAEGENIKNAVKTANMDVKNKIYKISKNTNINNISMTKKFIKQNDKILDFSYSESTMNDGIVKNVNISTDAKHLEITEQRIAEYKNAFGLNYDSDVHDRKMINLFETLAKNSDKIPDENVAKIVRNITSINKIESKFRIYEWDAISAYGNNNLMMGSVLLDSSEDTISPVLMHEFGHAYYHILNGDINNRYKIELSDSTKGIVLNTQKKLIETPSKYIEILKKSQKVYDEAFFETERWYDTQRAQEDIRIKEQVERIYSEDGGQNLNKIVKEAKDLGQVKTLLAESGMANAEIDEILRDKDLTTQILQTQNNISNQVKHFDEIMTSYSKNGDYRKLSSTINSVTQKINHIDPVTEKQVVCNYSHPDDYWTEKGLEDASRRTYDELMADYFSLASHGRTGVLEQMEDVFGSELMDSIRKDWKFIADELEQKGLLVN